MRAITRSGILSRFGMPLSKREHEIAGLVAKGLKNKQIAWELGLTEATIKAHMCSIYAKLHIHNRVQLTLYQQGDTAMDHKMLLDTLKGLILESRRDGVPDEDIAAALRQAAEDIEPTEDEDLDPAGEGD